MWIRSQDKSCLIQCNNFSVECHDNCFDIETLNGTYTTLGSYSTYAKALKVLDMIQAHLTKNEAGIYNSKFGVFQMPQDEDVVVFERHDNMEVKQDERID